MSFKAWRERLASEALAVVYGGHSNEREVSISSGTAVASALEGAGYEVRRVELNGDFLKQIDTLRGYLCFIAMHGRFGEDGELQKLLDARGVTYTGSAPEASRDAMDKGASKRIFQALGVPTPNYILVDRHDPAGALGAESVPFPAVVKPASCGSSIGVSVRVGRAGLDDALGRAFEHDDRVIVEEHIEGRELTVGVLGSRALPVIELRTPRGFYDYEAKYSDAKTEYICPAKLDAGVAAEVQRAASAAFHSLGCRDLGRVDVMLSADERPMVLEVNTIPGFTSHSLLPMAAKAVGISFSELCERILCFALARAAGASVAEEKGAWKAAS
jgi:D-alanine-D-alanine ligase